MTVHAPWLRSLAGLPATQGALGAGLLGAALALATVQADTLPGNRPAPQPAPPPGPARIGLPAERGALGPGPGEGGASAAGAAAPMRVTTDTPEYCEQLTQRVTRAQRNRSAAPGADSQRTEVEELLEQGHQMCTTGLVRGGLVRLRRAWMLLRADE